MSLLKRLEERMLDPTLVANFNREVSKKHKSTARDKRNMAQAHKAVEAYKKTNPNWKQHFE